MQINKAENLEELRIEHFVRGEKSMLLNNLTIQVNYGSSTFAVAAMLKGLNEFYFKPAGMKGDGEVMETSEKNLETWVKICDDQNKKSSLILP